MQPRRRDVDRHFALLHRFAALASARSCRACRAAFPEHTLEGSEPAPVTEAT